MTTSRSFVRLAITGFIVHALAIACVVSDDGDDGDGDACNPGDTADCTCSDKSEGTKTCNGTGTGYSLCDCDGTSSGGSGAGGSPSGDAGEGNSTAGTGATVNYGGADAGGASTGGAGGGASTGGAGGDAAGGLTSSGGAGGGENVPAICQEPSGPCEECYYAGCCAEWAACADDGTCLDELIDILACTDVIRETADVTTADLEQCAEDVGGTGSWSTGVSALTKEIVDCIAGEPGWEGSPWGATACNNSCFKQ